MYNFHYNFIKKRFDSELLFTDTGSLAYEIFLRKLIHKHDREAQKDSLMSKTNITSV